MFNCRSNLHGVSFISDEKLRIMQGFNPSVHPTKYGLYPSGLIKETYSDEDTKTTHKLTLKGFKQVEESKEEPEPSIHKCDEG